MSSKCSFNALILTVISAVIFALSSIAPPCAAEEIYGPVNLVKSLRTPFNSSEGSSAEPDTEMRPMSLQSRLNRSLSGRLLPSTMLYLPGRLVIGSTAEFIIKGKPGQWAALAMADRNQGARPIVGHDLKLGPDRKVVSLGQIPDTGVLALVIDTPIQGDLIGQPLYFEAALWTKPDFSDVEIATPIPSESAPSLGSDQTNGVIVAGEPNKKRGVRIVPEANMNLQQKQGIGLPNRDPGRP